MSDVFLPTRHKLSVEDYHKLGEAGVLNEDSRVELIEGELIDMAPIGAFHMHAVNRLNKLLVLAVGDQGVVSVQNPVTLPPHSEPQPDVTILKPASAGAPAAVPEPDEVLLLIEVADSTLAYDRGTKLKLYAKAGIVETWIVNLQARTVETYQDPTPNGYARRREYGSGEVVSPLALPGVRLTVVDILD